MTSIIHTVWDWSEKTMNKLNPETDKHAYAKAFGLGAVEGSIAAVSAILHCVITGKVRLKRSNSKIRAVLNDGSYFFARNNQAI